MNTIKIGRYHHESVTKDVAGWIEPDDRSWIIFLDAHGKPDTYYAKRASSGAVIGDPILLTDE